MGISRSPAELRRKFDRLAADVADLDTAVVKEASQAEKDAVLKRTPKGLRNVGWKKAKPGQPGSARGAKLGVRYNMGTFDGNAKSLVFATGPFQLIERNTKAHAIPAFVGQKSKQKGTPRGKKGRTYGPAFGGVRQGGAPINIPGVGWRTIAFHPGTKGKFPWAKGTKDAEAQVAALLEKRTALAVRRIFG